MSRILVGLLLASLIGVPAVGYTKDTLVVTWNELELRAVRETRLGPPWWRVRWPCCIRRSTMHGLRRLLSRSVRGSAASRDGLEKNRHSPIRKRR